MAQIPNVNPSELIASTWGNAVRDQTVQVFASAAERTAAIPSPKAGQVTYLTSPDSLEYWNGAAWLRVGPGQLAYKFVLAQQSGITSTVDLTGLSATVTVPAGRRLQLTASIAFFKSGSDQTGYAAALITDGANGLVVDRNTNIALSTYASVHLVTRVEPAAGTFTWKVRANTNVGFVNVMPVSMFMVDDIGPASMPD